METLLERPGEGQVLELLRLFVKKRVTKKMMQRILENSLLWFKQELYQKLLLLAMEETSKMEDGNEQNTCKTLCLALIASVTESETDIKALRKAISSEKYIGLNCFILLASITKKTEDFRAILGEVASSEGKFVDEIRSFVWLAKITETPTTYIVRAREKLASSVKESGLEPDDYYWIAVAATHVANFTKQGSDILFIRECVNKMAETEYYLRSTILLDLFKITEDKSDSSLARYLISKIPHSDLQRRQLAELAMLTKDPKDILAARQVVEDDGEALCYLAKATLSSSDINKAYKAVCGKERLLMTSIKEEDSGQYDVLLSAAIEAKRFDIVEKLIIDASGYHRVRHCIRAYNKLVDSIIN